MKKLSTTHLQPGMILARSIINDQMIVVLSENTLLTKAHITRLSFLNVQDAYIKDEYELNANYQSVEAMINRSNAFVTEYEEIVSTAREIFYASSKSEPLPVKKVEQLVDDSIVPAVQNSGALDYLYELNHLATDVYQHCVRVSILAGVIGKWMHLDRSKIKELILAGFLHDIGKTQLEQKILDKRLQNLTPEEYDLYMQHTILGHKLIAGNQEFSEGVKSAVLQHHERMDGSGFPFNAAQHERYGITMVAEVLRGSKNQNVLKMHFDELSTYGLFSSRSIKDIKLLIQRLAATGYLELTESEYPVLKLTPLAYEVLRSKAQVLQQIPTERKAAVDSTLFQQLRSLRKDIAARDNIPPYLVFSDATLQDMCQRLPQNLGELCEVKGIGERKLERYGQAFLDLLLKGK